MPASETEPNVRLCKAGCGKMTRPSRMPKTKAPGTVPRHDGSMCGACWRRANGRREPGQPLTEEQQAARDAEKQKGYAAAERAREAWDTARRAREAKRARMEELAQRQSVGV